jgi:hypothetical protein
MVVTQFAVLDYHRALSGARQQSDEVDSVQNGNTGIRILTTTASDTMALL